MMSMFLIVGDGQKFDREDVIRLLSSIEGTYNIYVPSKAQRASLVAEYEYGEELITVNLSEDFEGIVMTRMGDASIDLAFRIQQGYPKPLRAFDEGYNFDLLVSDYGTLAEFIDAIDNEKYDGTRNDPPE